MEDDRTILLSSSLLVLKCETDLHRKMNVDEPNTNGLLFYQLIDRNVKSPCSFPILNYNKALGERMGSAIILQRDGATTYFDIYTSRILILLNENSSQLTLRA